MPISTSHTTKEPKSWHTGGTEREVLISSGYKGDNRLQIHAWYRPGFNPESAVYVGLGQLRRDGRQKKPLKGQERESFENAIFDREEFVVALLDVFPELKLAD